MALRVNVHAIKNYIYITGEIPSNNGKKFAYIFFLSLPWLALKSLFARGSKTRTRDINIVLNVLNISGVWEYLSSVRR